MRARVELPGVSPRAAVRAFTDPAVLRRWWGGDLEAELKPGGSYVVQFEGLGQTMRGEVLSYDPDATLVFTWVWEHEDDPERREVAVRAVPIEGGTRIEVEHGPHGDSEAERERAASHREGWEHFLPRLAEEVVGQTRDDVRP